MGFNYTSNEKMPKWDRVNLVTDEAAQPSGSNLGAVTASFYLSGASPRVTPRLEYGHRYKVISRKNFHIISTPDPEVSASRESEYVPADEAKYHIPVSGASEYLSVFADDSGDIEVWISLVNNTRRGR